MCTGLLTAVAEDASSLHRILLVTIHNLHLVECVLHDVFDCCELFISSWVQVHFQSESRMIRAKNFYRPIMLKDHQ